MSKLVEKLLRARERTVEVEGHGYTIRRPSDAEALEMQGKAPFEFVKRFVVGWDLAEHEAVPGGGPEKVPFEADLWALYVGDHVELWEPLALAIFDDYAKHVAQREDDAKN